MRGRFIVVDGPSGVGKTTAIRHLAELLVDAGYPVHPTKEPTRTALGDTARYGTDTYRGLTLACLVAADRYHHLETEVQPALTAGKVVLCDRYLATSLVLQRIDGVAGDFIWAVNRHIRPPDLTLILIGDPARSRERAEARGIHSRFHRGGPEAGTQERQLYVRVADELAVAGHPVQIHEVSDQVPEAVAAALLDRVRPVLDSQTPTIEAALSSES